MSVHPTSLRPYILHANEGEAIWYTTTRMTLKATSESTGGALSLVEVLAAPDTAPPWHIHHRDSEMFYILDGSFLFKCGDEQFEAGPGSFVFLPGGIPTVSRLSVRQTPGSWFWAYLLASTGTSWIPVRPHWRRGCVHNPSILSKW